MDQGVGVAARTRPLASRHSPPTMATPAAAPEASALPPPCKDTATVVKAALADAAAATLAGRARDPDAAADAADKLTAAALTRLASLRRPLKFAVTACVGADSGDGAAVAAAAAWEGATDGGVTEVYRDGDVKAVMTAYWVAV